MTTPPMHVVTATEPLAMHRIFAVFVVANAIFRVFPILATKLKSCLINSASFSCVCHIISRSTCIQVFGAYTKWYIACMTDIIAFRYLAIKLFIDFSVCGFLSSLVPKLTIVKAITRRCSSTHPNQATIFLHNPRPEPITFVKRLPIALLSHHLIIPPQAKFSNGI